MGVQVPEINAKSKSPILFPYKDHCIAPSRVAGLDGSYIMHVENNNNKKKKNKKKKKHKTTKEEQITTLRKKHKITKEEQITTLKEDLKQNLQAKAQ